MSILTAGLVTAYTLLVYNVCKYYRQSMKTELKRLSILFAAFIISYFLRLIYVATSVSGIYEKIVSNWYTRIVIATMMPLVWDLTSIVAILVLHFISFRKS